MSNLNVHDLAQLPFGHAEAEIAAHEEEMAASKHGGHVSSLGCAPGVHRWSVTVRHEKASNNVLVNARTMRGAINAAIKNTTLTLPRGGGTLSISAERVSR